MSGPISVSDDEASAVPDLPAPTTTPTRLDAVETQAYVVDTQMVQEVLAGLDQEVPSPGQPLASARLPSTKVLPGYDDSPEPKATTARVEPSKEAVMTPSPKNLPEPKATDASVEEAVVTPSPKNLPEPNARVEEAVVTPSPKNLPEPKATDARVEEAVVTPSPKNLPEPKATDARVEEAVVTPSPKNLPEPKATDASMEPSKEAVLTPSPKNLFEPKATAASVEPSKEAVVTPSPKNLPFPEISPLKTCITRDGQLNAKGSHVMQEGRGRGRKVAGSEKKPEPMTETSKRKPGRPKKAAHKKAEETQKLEVDEIATHKAVHKTAETQKLEVAETATKKVKKLRRKRAPKKKQADPTDVPAVEKDIPKRKKGKIGDPSDVPVEKDIPKKKKGKIGDPTDVPVAKDIPKKKKGKIGVPIDTPAVEKDIPKKKKAKIGDPIDTPAVEEDIPKGKKGKIDDPTDVPAEAAVPTTRCRGKCAVVEPTKKKKRAASAPPGLHIRSATPMEDEWPKVFARRFRPSKDSWMQRLWDGCVRAFNSIIAPEMPSGQKCKLEACIFHYTDL